MTTLLFFQHFVEEIFGLLESDLQIAGWVDNTEEKVRNEWDK